MVERERLPIFLRSENIVQEATVRKIIITAMTISEELG
ncbi:hypothetical protein N748_11435 [Legionella pneumophila str. 121004]|nr:hypothetical protein N748_11435 [Legionella pneumophila str. 121004]ERH45859.1 hypothetical protein N751_09620 [Legionella pneumophila str. Leg01/11]ERH46356.1 hypothetical protein N750_04755 [Legionella pneumophila str. Leg01/53]ERI47844.1 hypothetical protein N749_12685 [Legionella pneumophila str. Leg01/20]